MKKTFAFMACFFCLGIIIPCGWDWDTVQMEKQQFPQVHELITGKFYRHSPELYYWRIKHRTALLQRYPDSLSLYDDLAMAYDKTGDAGKAIEIMQTKEKRKPGLYETYANLGLFYMHHNETKKGVEYVQKALKVNPNAHFGREKYQLHLGNYILQQMQGDSLILPLTKGERTGFYDYLRRYEFKHRDIKSDAHFNELSEAIKGVAGMMTFANYRSPVLLEALADLLVHTNSARGAGHLASRAYLKASWETTGATRKDYYEKAKWAREQSYPGEHIPIPRQHGGDSSIVINSPGMPLFAINDLETALKYEVQSAEIWFDSLRRNEISWIKTGKNPDTEFAKKYYAQTELKNVAVDVYGTSRIKHKVVDSVWLAQQLSRPENIKSIHGFNTLPDSTRAMLDEIYEKEFAVHEKPEAEKATEAPKQEKTNETSSLVKALYVMVGLLGLLVIWRVYKATRKRV